MKLPEINIKKIRERRLKRFIPELYDLEKVIENNPWHNEESVFDHTVSVLNNLEKIIRNLKKENKQALNEIIDKYSRKDLLKIATLLHDIGKKETITILGDDIRACPGHERFGAEKVEKVLKRFNFSQKEIKIITEIIKNHGTMHDIVGLGSKGFRKDIMKERNLTHAVIGLEKKNFQKEYKGFKKRFSNILLEIILLAFADTVASYLKKTKPAEFRHRVNFYEKELRSLPRF